MGTHEGGIRGGAPDEWRGPVRNANKFTGTYTVDLFDVTGMATDHFEGQLAGIRVNPV
jgi:hypothetical protein